MRCVNQVRPASLPAFASRGPCIPSRPLSIGHQSFRARAIGLSERKSSPSRAPWSSSQPECSLQEVPVLPYDMAYQDYDIESSSDEEDYQDATDFSSGPLMEERNVSSQDEDSASECAVAEEPPISKMAARAYQVEMLEASLEKNVIVAVSLIALSLSLSNLRPRSPADASITQMDTGSGKTHV